jgi:hypothetical protein
MWEGLFCFEMSDKRTIIDNEAVDGPARGREPGREQRRRMMMMMMADEEEGERKKKGICLRRLKKSTTRRTNARRALGPALRPKLSQGTLIGQQPAAKQHAISHHSHAAPRK